MLKGGYALELRFLHARATKDIDLTLSSGVIQTSTFEEQRLRLREHIRSYSSRTLPDFFEYFIGSSTLDLEGAPEGGFRFPVEANMDGRVFANFHVDIGVGDATDLPLEILQGGDWLEFVGIPRPQFVAVSREQQWAEKLHAYTRPRLQRRQDIQRRLSQGETVSALAREFKTTRQTIIRARNSLSVAAAS